MNTQPKKFRRRCDGHTNITSVKKLLMKIDSRLSELTGVKDIMRAAGLLEWLHEAYCTHQELIQAIANHGLDAAPNGINCCSCHGNTISPNDFTIPISDDEEENIFWDKTSCNTQPVTFKQRYINLDMDVSTVYANNLIGFSFYKFAPGNDFILFHRFSDSTSMSVS